jgi:hypothetical protein
MEKETIGLNLATSNSWIAVIPYNIIDPDNGNEIAFNLRSFNYAGVIMSGADIPRYGEMFPKPSGAVESDKIVTFRYKPDSEWKQYEFLFRWFDLIANNKKLDHSEYNSWINSSLVNVKIYLLNEYKKPKLKWTFNNCWLKEFGELDMEYDSAGGTGLDHGFSLQYMDYDFERVENFDD